MKVLIFTMTCGEGHNAIAKGMKTNLEKNNIECKIADIFESDTKSLEFNNKGYLTMCKYFPHIYSLGWRFIRNRNPKKRFTGSSYAAIKKVIDYNLNIILGYKPDAIVCTHTYCSNLVSTLFEKKKLSHIPTYSFVFDYTLCPFWEDSINIDKVFIPNDIVHDDLIKVGFRPDQIVKTGFPSQEKFYKKIEKSKARKMLGINAHKFTALLISGGNGLGNTFKLMQNILKSDFQDNIQLLIVCGKNEQMKQKIDHYIAENEIYNVFNYGFVDNVNELMSASDCVFTRSGGGTLSEALNIGVVPILRERTQANETINKKLFIQNNLAFGMKHITDAKKILNSIKHEPSLLSEKQKNIKKFNIPNGLINATNYIIDNLNTKQEPKISDT